MCYFSKYLLAIGVLKAASGRVCVWLLTHKRSMSGYSVAAGLFFFYPTEQTDGVVRRILCQAMVDEIADGRKLVKDLISCAL